MQPGFGRTPFPANGDRREFHHFGRFLDSQSPKKPQFHDPALPRIHIRQARKGIVKRHKLRRSLLTNNRNVIERKMLGASSALAITMPARMVDQNMSHNLRRRRKEVSTILPLDFFLIHESQVCLIDQCRGLQGVGGILPGHVAPGQSLQFRMDERYQAIEGFSITFAPT
jgi:hypothetical protein